MGVRVGECGDKSNSSIKLGLDSAAALSRFLVPYSSAAIIPI